MAEPPATIERLHASLTRRETPETVAELIRAGMGSRASRSVRIALRPVIGGSLKRWFGWTAMSTRFKAPVSMSDQVAKARELARLFLDRSLPGGDDPDALEPFVAG